MVLGMPWLRHYNPIINWDRRSMELKSKGDKERPVNEKEPFDLRSDELRKKDAVVLAAHIRPKKIGKETAGKGGYNWWNSLAKLRQKSGAATPRVTTTKDHEQNCEETKERQLQGYELPDYEERLREVKEKLPEELQRFTDVFCKKL